MSNNIERLQRPNVIKDEIEIEIKIFGSPPEQVIDNFKTLVEDCALNEFSTKIKWTTNNIAKTRIFIRGIGSRFDPEQVAYDIKSIGCDLNHQNSAQFRQYFFGATVYIDIWNDKIENVPSLMLEHKGETSGYKMSSTTRDNVKKILKEITQKNRYL